MNKASDSARGDSDRLDPKDDVLSLERLRISGEIHDELIPLLFACSAKTHSLAASSSASTSSPPEDSLAQLAAWQTEAMQVARKILNDTASVDFGERSWHRAAYDRLTMLFPAKANLIRWDCKSETESLPQTIAEACYRITVEACRNAISHGQADAVSIEAALDDGILSLQIADDGIGFEPGKVPAERFGVRLMHARARAIGGSLVIRSSDTGSSVTGTEVCLRATIRAAMPC